MTSLMFVFFLCQKRFNSVEDLSAQSHSALPPSPPSVPPSPACSSSLSSSWFMKCLICKIKYHQHLSKGNHSQHGAVTSPQPKKKKNGQMRYSGWKTPFGKYQGCRSWWMLQEVCLFSAIINHVVCKSNMSHVSCKGWARRQG